MAGVSNTQFGAPPLNTPITAQTQDQFGVAYQNRDVPAGNVSGPWAQWFSNLGVKASSGNTIQDTRANRVNYPASTYPGSFYFETDSGLLYFSKVTAGVYAWTWIAGTYARTQAQMAALAASLVAGDTGMRIYVSDYYHTLWCTGATATDWAPEDARAAGQIGHFDVAPGNGWKLIDGKGDDGSPIGASHPIKILKSDGTTRSNTTAAAMNAGVFLRGAAAYNGAVTAATVPTIAAPVFSGTPSNTGGENGDRSINNGSGGTLVGSGMVLTDIPASPHTHSFTPDGTNSAPAATLPAPPVDFTDALPYIRK